EERGIENEEVKRDWRSSLLNSSFLIAHFSWRPVLQAPQRRARFARQTRADVVAGQLLQGAAGGRRGAAFEDFESAEQPGLARPALLDALQQRLDTAPRFQR